MKFSNGDYVKTHCFSDRGRVVIADYDGLKVVDGNFIEDMVSDNMAVNIVMRVNLPNHINPFQFSSRFISQVNDFGSGKPVIQRLDDLRNFSSSNPERVLDSSIRPTLSDCKHGDLSQIYPLRFENVIKFLDLTDKILPGFAFPDNLIYGPFIEWWMKKVETNKYFETNIKNLYTIGDGAGMSQGITAAAIQGIACARGVIKKEN
jgi:hypothetical protein